MISQLVASLLSITQPAGPPEPLVVELCNTTPSRVAFSVVYPGATVTHRRRGWLTVEPNDCLSGAIGTSVGGDAYVHAISGEYRWPADGGDISSCIPPNAHDSLAEAPACQQGLRETRFERVPLTDRRGRYELSHSVSCADLIGSDIETCRTGRRDRDGFAEPVRTLEVCNFSTGAVEVATAAEARGGAGRQITGWTSIEGGGQCARVWRGLSVHPEVYLHIRGDVPFRAGPEPARHCVPIEGDFDLVIGSVGESECADGQTGLAFRAVRFAPNVALMSFDIGN